MLTLPVMIGITSFAVDFGRLQLVKLELRRAADAGARYGAAGLHAGPSSVASRAKQAASENAADGVAVDPADVAVEYGRYDYAAKAFVPLTVYSYEADAVRVTVTRTVQTTFRGAVGASSAVTVSGSSVAFVPGALLVGGAASIEASDQSMRGLLWAMGLSVRYKAASATTAADAAGQAVVVLSESMSASALNSKLRDVAVPVVCYEPFLFDDLKMTSTNGSDFGWAAANTQIQWVRPDLMGGYSGPYPVNAAAVQVAFGKPGASALVVATTTGDASQATVFLYDKGASMVGMAAPHRRIGVWVGDGGQLNANGRTLFAGAVSYAVGGGRSVVTVK